MRMDHIFRVFDYHLTQNLPPIAKAFTNKVMPRKIDVS